MDLIEAIKNQLAIIEERLKRTNKSFRPNNWNELELNAMNLVSLSQVLDSMAKEGKAGKLTW